MKFWKRKGFKKIAAVAVRAGAAWSTGGTSEALYLKAKGIQSMFRSPKQPSSMGVMPGGAPFDQGQLPGNSFGYAPQRQVMSRQPSGAKPWWVR